MRALPCGGCGEHGAAAYHYGGLQIIALGRLVVLQGLTTVDDINPALPIIRNIPLFP